MNMRTSKKLIIGAVALAAVCAGMQAQSNESEFIGEKTVLDYKNAGLKEFKLHHRLYNARTLDLRNNDLDELVLPAGMIDLGSLILKGNPNLTNLVIQMDTSIDSSTFYNLYVRLDRDFKNLRVSFLSWMLENQHGNKRISLRPLEDFGEVEIRPNGVEMLRHSETIPSLKNIWIVVFGEGELQVSSKISGKWRDIQCSGRRCLRRREAYGGTYAGGYGSGWVWWLATSGVGPNL